MIDEVHMLTNDAFNAMLKTLEEPPEYLKFVLATTDPQKMPPTVLSRCLQFNLRPMAPQTVHEHLARCCAPRASPPTPARCGCSRARRAARCAMRCRSPTRRSPTAAARSRKTACARCSARSIAATRCGCVEALAARDGAALIAAVDGLRELGLSAAGTLEEMAALLQQMAVLQAVPGALDDDDPDARRRRAPGGAAAGRRDAAALQHRRCTAAPSSPLAPDEYSGLVMVLLRMLAFAPAEARAETRAAAGDRRRAEAPRRVPRRRRRRRGAARRLAPPRATRRAPAPRRAADAGDVRDARRRRRRAPASPSRRRRRRRVDGAPPADRWAELVRRLVAGRRASPRWCASWRCRRSASRVDEARRRDALAAARRARNAARAGAARQAAGGAGRGAGAAGAARASKPARPTTRRRGATPPSARAARREAEQDHPRRPAGARP